jgi:hypothetical protein
MEVLEPQGAIIWCFRGVLLHVVVPASTVDSADKVEVQWYAITCMEAEALHACN